MSARTATPRAIAIGTDVLAVERAGGTLQFCDPTIEFARPGLLRPDDGDRDVLVDTTLGPIRVALAPEAAPNTAWNFRHLAENGFYDDTTFHRVVHFDRTGRRFVIQGGDPNTKKDDERMWGTGGPGWSVDAEFNDVHHERGILSMARSQDPNSAGSQFFVCHGEAGFLDGQYTAFGKLLDGFEVLDEIANAPTLPGGEGSRPKEPVTVTKATVVESTEG